MGKVKIGRIGHNRVRNWEGRDSIIDEEQRNYLCSCAFLQHLLNVN